MNGKMKYRYQGEGVQRAMDGLEPGLRRALQERLDGIEEMARDGVFADVEAWAEVDASLRWVFRRFAEECTGERENEELCLKVAEECELVDLLAMCEVVRAIGAQVMRVAVVVG